MKAKYIDRAFADQMLQIVGQEGIWRDEPMKKHTTFRVGGPADLLVCPKNASEIVSILNLCQKAGVPYFIIGNGSNLLVSDAGYRGVILKIYKNMNSVRVEGDRIFAQAGALLSAVSHKAMEAGLSGMEFASGIPGTLGGACVMNAGAYGGEMKDCLESVTVLTVNGEVCTLPAEKLKLGYRYSTIKDRGDIVLEAVLRLHGKNREAIAAYMQELKEKRLEKQPLDYPSAGSTFKRPEGYFAGKLIQDAGLRGYRVGGAQVSDKHCGFVINTGDASAADIMKLIRDVQAVVYEKFQVRMEPEVKFLGEFEVQK